MLQNRRFGRFLGKIRRVAPLALLDTVVLVLAYIAVYSVRTTSAITGLTEQGFEFAALAIMVMVVCLFVAGGYNRLWARTSGHDVTVLVNGVILASAVLIPLDFF